MNNDGIEDILISKEDNGYTKKKKPKGVLIVFFLLLIVLIAFVGAYWYLTKDTVSSKQLFVQNISQVNVNKLLKNELYTNLLEKMQKESFQSDSSVKFTTDLEKEELQDIDVTKFDLNISTSNDAINQKNYSEAVLNYSGNEVFKLRSAGQENELALASDEIMNQYVGIHLDKTKDVFGIDIDMERLNELKAIENINLSEDEINEIIKKYFNVIINNIPEEKFSIQQNIAIENATEDVEVTNYSVTLTQEELNQAIILFLEEVKEDEELIGKLIVASEQDDSDNDNNENISTENTVGNTVEQQGNQQEENTVVQSENVVTQPENAEEQPESEEVENQQEETPSTEENLNPEIPVIHINPVGTINISNTVETENTNTADENIVNESTENINIEDANQENATEEATTANQENSQNEEIETIESTNIEELIDNENKTEEQITNIIFGKKVDLTKEEFKASIDQLISEVEKFSGNGININVYSSVNNVEKLNIVLPNDGILDIDFIPDDNLELNSNQSYIKVTYLNENEEAVKNGFSLVLNKEQSTANTTINAEYNFIENEKINQKIKIALKTDGTANAKSLKNEIVFTLSNNKSETQIAVDNKIEFKEISDLPGLNAENCIYLDLLPEEERKTLIDTITNQIKTLYESKKENLKFIDTNTYSQTTLENQNQVQTQTPTVTREVAKEALINKIVEMMDAAIAKGEEFTIQNLKDLEMEGYKVSVAVTSEAALVVVDSYKFNIDTGFVLTDVE